MTQDLEDMIPEKNINQTFMYCDRVITAFGRRMNAVISPNGRQAIPTPPNIYKHWREQLVIRFFFKGNLKLKHQLTTKDTELDIRQFYPYPFPVYVALLSKIEQSSYREKN